jgi:hypothetical protein
LSESNSNSSRVIMLDSSKCQSTTTTKQFHFSGEMPNFVAREKLRESQRQGNKSVIVSRSAPAPAPTANITPGGDQPSRQNLERLSSKRSLDGDCLAWHFPCDL